MDVTRLLEEGFTWTAARIAGVPADGLGLPTPCNLWDLEELLDHVVDTLTMLTEAVEPATAAVPEVRAVGPSRWDRAIAELAARSSRAWRAPGVLDRTMELPIGTLPATAVALSSLLELVVHGWDVGQATGEAAEIPDALAVAVLDFARPALAEAGRGEAFDADVGAGVGLGGTPSDQLVAFLGRKPL